MESSTGNVRGWQHRHEFPHDKHRLEPHSMLSSERVWVSLVCHSPLCSLTSHTRPAVFIPDSCCQLTLTSLISLCGTALHPRYQQNNTNLGLLKTPHNQKQKSLFNILLTQIVKSLTWLKRRGCFYTRQLSQFNIYFQRFNFPTT